MATGKLRADDMIGDDLAKGRYGDGEGLYFVVAPGGSRNWTFLYDVVVGGKKTRRELGLGGFPRTSDPDKVRKAAFNRSREAARDKANAHRVTLKAGRDPKDNAATGAADKTFKTVAGVFLDDNEAGWANAKHRAQWRTTLDTYAGPLTAKAVDTITVDDVRAVLMQLVVVDKAQGRKEPLWLAMPETASRVRQRIERVLAAAKARGLRSGDNPAAWRDNLKHLLPRHGKDVKSNHPAMPFGDVAEFVGMLRGSEGVAAMMLEFTILTAARTGEVIGARWSEIDLSGAVWTIPAARMKAKVEHRVPLSARAVAILKAMLPFKRSDDGPVFPGASPGGGLSNMAMIMVLDRLGRRDITVHGFRSAFRDWAAETTGFPHEVCEMALAHTIRNKAEAAYRRGDLFAKRRELMDTWAAYCEPAEAGSVVLPLAKAG